MPHCPLSGPMWASKAGNAHTRSSHIRSHMHMQQRRDPATCEAGQTRHALTGHITQVSHRQEPPVYCSSSPSKPASEQGQGTQACNGAHHDNPDRPVADGENTLRSVRRADAHPAAVKNTVAAARAAPL
jgi:hypothetical protein